MKIVCKYLGARNLCTMPCKGFCSKVDRCKNKTKNTTHKNCGIGNRCIGDDECSNVKYIFKEDPICT